MINMNDKIDFNDEDDEDHYDIKTLDQKIDASNIRKKDDDNLKLVETVFDEKTRLILLSMINRGVFNGIEGAISTGKEANVYFASTSSQPVAIKIFRIDAPSFRKMKPYVTGDHRFKRYRGTRSGFIEVWAKKEFKNLKRILDVGISAPKPMVVERNILVMEYLGTENSVLPRLKDVVPDEPKLLYKNIMNTVKVLYTDAKLVHADLSEFNILIDPSINKYYIIDVSQAILNDHPKADLYLLRDLQNLNRYFGLLGIPLLELEKLFKWICGRDVDPILLYDLNG